MLMFVRSFHAGARLWLTVGLILCDPIVHSCRIDDVGAWGANWGARSRGDHDTLSNPFCS